MTVSKDKETDVYSDYEAGRKEAYEDLRRLLDFELGYEDEINAHKLMEFRRFVPACDNEPACTIHYLVQIVISKEYHSDINEDL